MSVRTALILSWFRSWKVVPRAAAAIMLPWASGCIAGDSRCDANQVVIADSCVCVPGSAPNESGYGCTLCGANEAVQNGKCACVVGYTRSAAGVCEQSAIGMACNDDTGCPAAYPHCLTDGAEKYCTAQGCTASSCPTGYACEQSGAAMNCAKLPTGLGDACTSNADCTKEANFCDTFMTRKCILTSCAGGAVTCPGFYACCDLSMVVPGFSSCFPPEALMNGQCPPPGVLVTP